MEAPRMGMCTSLVLPGSSDLPKRCVAVTQLQSCSPHLHGCRGGGITDVVSGVQLDYSANLNLLG